MVEAEIVLDYLADVDRATSGHALRRQQAIRDAHAAGATVTEIAAALGVRNRAGVYEALKTDKAGSTPATVSPAPTPVVFLRGAGADADDWQLMTSAMQARGWWVVRDRTQAWHLARGRVPVVMVDFTAGEPTVGRVKARYDDAGRPELPLDGPRTTVPEGSDAQAIALAVVDHLRDPRVRREPTPESPAAARLADLVGFAAQSAGVTRPILISDELWDRVQDVDDISALVAETVMERIIEIEGQYNSGEPFPSVDRLPTGPRGRPAERLKGSQRQIRMTSAAWDRARAVVAAGHAPSLPALIESALRSALDPT